VHTAESAPDTSGADSGAENVANFIRNRTDPGSYHDLCDSDSVINLVRYECEAYHDGTGSNSHSYGVSAATQAARWLSVPKDWRDRCVDNMARAAARYALWLREQRGIVIPAKRITRAQSEARIPGFISHAERDPARRSDPGKDFPWGPFLERFAQLTGKTPALEDDVTPDDHKQINKNIETALIRHMQFLTLGVTNPLYNANQTAKIAEDGTTNPKVVKEVNATYAVAMAGLSDDLDAVKDALARIELRAQAIQRDLGTIMPDA
jgi:hypothetical protein